LAVETGDSLVKCAYCNKRNRVRSMRTLAMQRPDDWSPPPQWTPPEEAKAKSKPLNYEKPSLLPRLMVFISVIGVLVAGVLALPLDELGFGEVIAPIRGLVEDDAGPPKSEDLWDGTEPFTCSGHDELFLERLDIELTNRTAVEVSDHCQLTIRDSEIVAWEGVTVTDHGRLVLERCTIRANEAVVSATGHAHVEVVDSELISAGVAIEVARRSEVVLAGGSVSGTPRAIARRARRRVEVRGAEVHDVVPDAGHRRRRRHHKAPQQMSMASPCERQCEHKHAECLGLSETDFERSECNKYDESCRALCD